MCDFRKMLISSWKWCLNHGKWIALFGFLSLIISIILLVFVINSLWIPFLYVGVALAVLGILFITTKKLTENLWGNFYLYIIVLIILLGILIVPMNQIQQKDMQTLLNVFITVDFAILAVIFAGLTINPNKIVTILKNGSSIEYFKIFVNFTAFSLLFTFIVYCISFFETGNNQILNPSAFDLHAFNVLFWAVTSLTLLAIYNMMFFIWRIFEGILNEP